MTGTLADLATLIHCIAEIDGIDRIRFTTSHPLEFSDALIEAYATCPSWRIICTCQCSQGRTAS